MCTQEEFDTIQELAETIESAMHDIDRAIQQANPGLHEQWKAYGKQVTNEFVSMGPSLPEVVEQLENDITSEDGKDDEHCECCEKPSCRDCEYNGE